MESHLRYDPDVATRRFPGMPGRRPHPGDLVRRRSRRMSDIQSPEWWL